MALLKDPAKAKELKDTISGKLEKVTITNNDIESSWKQLKEALADSSKKVMEFAKHKGEDWFDENNLKVTSVNESMHEKHRIFMNDKKFQDQKANICADKELCSKTPPLNERNLVDQQS